MKGVLTYIKEIWDIDIYLVYSVPLLLLYIRVDLILVGPEHDGYFKGICKPFSCLLWVSPIGIWHVTKSQWNIPSLSRCISMWLYLHFSGISLQLRKCSSNFIIHQVHPACPWHPGSLLVLVGHLLLWWW